MNIFNCILSYIKKFRIKRDIEADREYEGIRYKRKNHAVSIDVLQEGDFLFCRPRRDVEGKNIQSNVIQSFTGGYYTHCAIYIGNGEALHAVQPCVARILLDDLLKEYDYLVATRLHSTNNKSLINFVNQNIGKPYNLKGAIYAPYFEEKYVVRQNIRYMGKPKISSRRQIKNKLFCSQLLMEYMAYNCLEQHQQVERYFQSEYWTPTGLAKYGYGDFFKLIGFLSAPANFDRDYFLTGNMQN